MRAVVRYEYVGPIEVADIGVPVPRKDEVLIRVAAAGIDAGADHLMRGEPSVVRLGLGVGRPRDPRFGTEVKRQRLERRPVLSPTGKNQVQACGRGMFSRHAAGVSGQRRHAG